MGIVKCKLCGEDIVWVKLDSGESVACDPKPVRSSHIDGMLVLKPHDCYATQNKVIEISQAMKPSEAIENIEYARRWMGCESDFSEEALDMAIFALKKLEKDRWIPVTERLPEENGTYLACYEDATVLLDWFNGKWFFYRTNPAVEETGTIIAWRPLPEPYTEEEA